MPGPRKRVFIGDVHGCAEELDDLLEALAYDPARHDLWFVGDLVNRGPDSLAALRRAHGLGAGCVLGNHDLHLIGRAAGLREAKRGDTLDEILAAPDREELVGWLRDRPAMAFWEDLVLVHAGLHPQWSDLEAVASRISEQVDWSCDPFAQEDLRFCATVRYCDPAGGTPRKSEEPGPPFVPWDALYRGPRTVVFGHWAQRGLVTGDLVRGLDSRCVWGGRLTAWITEEDRLVSVPARREYLDWRDFP